MRVALGCLSPLSIKALHLAATQLATSGVAIPVLPKNTQSPLTLPQTFGEPREERRKRADKLLIARLTVSGLILPSLLGHGPLKVAMSSGLLAMETLQISCFGSLYGQTIMYVLGLFRLLSPAPTVIQSFAAACATVCANQFRSLGSYQLHHWQQRNKS